VQTSAAPVSPANPARPVQSFWSCQTTQVRQRPLPLSASPTVKRRSWVPRCAWALTLARPGSTRRESTSRKFLFIRQVLEGTPVSSSERSGARLQENFSVPEQWSQMRGGSTNGVNRPQGLRC